MLEEMNFKFILCFLFIIFSVSVSKTVDVRCDEDAEYYKSTQICVIKGTIKIEYGDFLNIINVTNASEIKQLYFYPGEGIESKIFSFPSQIFKQFPLVEDVKIINESMQSLVKESLRNAEKLTKLNVNLNKIKTIPSNVISLAPKLEDLFLAKNEISEIEDFAFNSSSLRLLYLSKNKIKSIRKNIFFYASQCKIIHLDENFIENIEDGAFDLPKLETINLDRNNLKTLPPNLFTNIPKLYLLSMGANKLSTDIVSALRKATQLRELILYENPGLSGVNLSSLSELSKLETLNLRSTDLTYSTIANLPDLPALTKLFINNNGFSYRYLLLLLGRLKSLEILDIERNNFTKLVDFRKITSYLPSVRVIYVDDNNWDCAWIISARRTCESTSIECFGLPPNCE